MRVTVIGTGYVGLVTGTCLAEIGNLVTCIDIDTQKLQKLQAGEVPIYEPDLDPLFKRNIKEGRLKFTHDLADGIEGAEVIFLALPTPPGQDGSADLSYILGVADNLSTLISDYVVIVDKSTVPVGTAQRVSKHLAQNAKAQFDVVSNPEFLREGFAVSDFLNPDRIIVGTSSAKARLLMEKLYEPLTRQGSPLYFMDERSAEMTKYAANAFLATKISFMNEVANLCEQLGADVDAVRQGLGSDERIGKHFLYPGIGYGGSCFPKDVLALQHMAQAHDYDFKILDAVQNVNAYQKQHLTNKISVYYGDKLEGKTFALWGLAFKPDTDDIREAPALEIIKTLLLAGARVVAYDPEAMANTKKYFPDKAGLMFAHDEYSALKDADALVIATEWGEFKTPDFGKMKALLKQPVIFDGRNLYDINSMRQTGFYYQSIGRETLKHGS